MRAFVTGGTGFIGKRVVRRVASAVRARQPVADVRGIGDEASSSELDHGEGPRLVPGLDEDAGVGVRQAGHLQETRRDRQNHDQPRDLFDVYRRHGG